MSDEFTVRLATLADVPTLCAHRRGMFSDMGVGTDAQLDAMVACFIPWVTERMVRNEYLTWLAVNPVGEVVAGAGVWLMEWPPQPFDQSPRRAYVLNVYTEPDYRRRGLARRLMHEILAWCLERNMYAMLLHASDAGRSLYESLGFQQTNEMRLVLGHPASQS